MAKYRQVVPTGAPGADGEVRSCGGIAAAAGPSVATITAERAVTVEVLRRRRPRCRRRPRARSRSPSRPAHASGREPRQKLRRHGLDPARPPAVLTVASIRMTELNSRELVRNSGLKKIPDMNGLKNLCVISSLNPAASSLCRIVVSGARRMS